MCTRRCQQVTGVEKCQWQEQSGSGDNRHTETYRGSHTIFKVREHLCSCSTASICNVDSFCVALITITSG